MIQVKPQITQQTPCPYCHHDLKPDKVLWQGMHVCAESHCSRCGAQLLDELRIGHALLYPHCLDIAAGRVFDSVQTLPWRQALGQGWGHSLLNSLRNPSFRSLAIEKEVFCHAPRVVILNCIDHLYGHCLLKLLNAQRHLEQNPNLGLIVIVPRFLRWLVPDGVAEIWTTDIALRDGQQYFPGFSQFVMAEIERFDEVFVSEAYSHPAHFDITRFSKVPRFTAETGRAPLVTFVWREDRLWTNSLLWRAVKRLASVDTPALMAQNRNIQRLFASVATKVPTAQFSVAGLGTRTRFPDWIEDRRTDRFTAKIERELCNLYALSAIVIGVHGSNMLLPSAHAGATIDLMPRGRWDNFAQDILFQESDPRISAFRYRFVPVGTDIEEIARLTASLYWTWPWYSQSMRMDT